MAHTTALVAGEEETQQQQQQRVAVELQRVEIVDNTLFKASSTAIIDNPIIEMALLSTGKHGTLF